MNPRDLRLLAIAVLLFGSAWPIAKDALRDATPAWFALSRAGLAAIVTAAHPRWPRGHHPATRCFQAIRLFINRELEELEAALAAATRVLVPGGRLAVLTFHSLEDRRVKKFLADRAQGCICPPDLPVCACGRTPEAEPIFRRSVVPTPGEIAHNPRAKSARLRASRKLQTGPEVSGPGLGEVA